MTQNRMTPERLAEIRRTKNEQWPRATILALLAELDAVTKERDDIRAELVKLAAELGTALRQRDAAQALCSHHAAMRLGGL